MDSVATNAEKSKTFEIAVIYLIILIGCGIVARKIFFEFNKRLNAIESRLSYIETANTLKGAVDLTNTNLQSIDGQFLAGSFSVEQHLTGMNVSGLLVNPTALSHENIKMKFTISGQTKEFSIDRLRAGASRRFSIYVPDVPLANSRYALIEYVESLVSYSKG